MSRRRMLLQDQAIDISSAVITAANQTYNGSAKTPIPTVTLDSTILPSSCYDIAYSNNINAGTATITVTGKDGYKGTATGTFIIAKASRTISFASTYMVLDLNSTGTKTATPSAGSGDGAITYSISNTTYATIDSSTGVVTSKTSDGSAIVTATIAEGTNYLSASASYNLYVFDTTHDFAYTGSEQDLSLPPGSYKLQCWGAQGGSNGTNSTYGITAKEGGKGGYSEGVLTVDNLTAIKINVGGQGSSSTGGFNGGGSTTGSSSYNSSNENGVSRMGGGGGATDIRLSDGALLSRMIVAGGGAGGAMCYRSKTTTTTTWTTISTQTSQREQNGTMVIHSVYFGNLTPGTKVRFKCTKTTAGTTETRRLNYFSNSTTRISFSDDVWSFGSYYTFTLPSNCTIITIQTINRNSTDPDAFSCVLEKETSSSSTTTTTDSQVGGVGGGTQGGGYSSTYVGKQDAAGTGGSFGQGANQATTGYRYCSGAGGGGWYGGGGGQKSDSTMTYCKYSGGGSGWVNIAANAGNRPSGYTGLQLDSGETKAGDTSFPNTAGTGNEIGHSGNGYIKITRLS